MPTSSRVAPMAAGHSSARIHLPGFDPRHTDRGVLHPPGGWETSLGDKALPTPSTCAHHVRRCDRLPSRSPASPITPPAGRASPLCSDPNTRHRSDAGSPVSGTLLVRRSRDSDSASARTGRTSLWPALDRRPYDRPGPVKPPGPGHGGSEPPRALRHGQEECQRGQLTRNIRTSGACWRPRAVCSPAGLRSMHQRRGVSRRKRPRSRGMSRRSGDVRI